LGGGDDLVVDVGDVARIDEAVPAVLVTDHPCQSVEDHGRPRVADMGAAVDGGPAYIHGDALRIGRNELSLLSRQRVVKADHVPCPTLFTRSRRVSTQSTIDRPLALSSGNVRDLVIHSGRSAWG